MRTGGKLGQMEYLGRGKRSWVWVTQYARPLCPPQPRSMLQPLWDASIILAQFSEVAALWMFNLNLVQTRSVSKWSHH